MTGQSLATVLKNSILHLHYIDCVAFAIAFLCKSPFRCPCCLMMCWPLKGSVSQSSFNAFTSIIMWSDDRLFVWMGQMLWIGGARTARSHSNWWGKVISLGWNLNQASHYSMCQFRVCEAWTFVLKIFEEIDSDRLIFLGFKMSKIWIIWRDSDQSSDNETYAVQTISLSVTWHLKYLKNNV